MEHLHVEIPRELKRLIVQTAKADGLKLNAFIAKVTAQYLGAPELGVIPQGEIGGRPPKELAAAK